MGQYMDIESAVRGLSLRQAMNLTPQGKASTTAYDNRRQASKLARLANNKKAGPKTASTAKVLSKAKQGDPKAKALIVSTQKKAKAGDPKAKAAVARLKVLNAATKPSRGLNRLYDHGVT